jgi:hypothetical protein
MGGGVDVRCGGFVKRTHGGMGQQGGPWWSCDVGKCSGMVDRWRTWVSLAKDERCWVWVLGAQSSWMDAISGDEHRLWRRRRGVD